MLGNGKGSSWRHCHKGAELRDVTSRHVTSRHAMIPGSQLFTFSWQCSEHCLFIIRCCTGLELLIVGLMYNCEHVL